MRGMIEEYREEIRYTLEGNPEASFAKKALLVGATILLTHIGRADEARYEHSPVAATVEQPYYRDRTPQEQAALDALITEKTD